MSRSSDPEGTTMSRSHRRFPFSYYVGGSSQAEWKTSYHRCLRRAVRQRLVRDAEDEDLLLPTLDEVADPWDSPRDGTGHYRPFQPNDGWWFNPQQPAIPARFAHYKLALMK